MLWSKLGITAVLQLALGWLLGLMLIPVFRRMKTGKYSPYIGDRFRTDGSEPAFGGVNALIVFAFGSFVSAAFTERSAVLIAAAIFAAAVTAAGIFDDILIDLRGSNVGIKTSAKLLYTYAACLALTLVSVRAGWSGTAVILPFGAGILDFGIAWYPVNAAVMTAVIYSFRVMNRFGTDEETCIGGLAGTVGSVAALGISAAGTAARNDELTALGMTAAAALMTSLIWGLSPSKQRSGSSGGFFAGAVIAAGLAMSGMFAFAVLLTAGAAALDAVCGAVQFLHYRRTKKLLLKGSTLHGHLKNKGSGERGGREFSVIAVFAVIDIVCCAAAVWLAGYGFDKYY